MTTGTSIWGMTPTGVIMVILLKKLCKFLLLRGSFHCMFNIYWLGFITFRLFSFQYPLYNDNVYLAVNKPVVYNFFESAECLWTGFSFERNLSKSPRRACVDDHFSAIISGTGWFWWIWNNGVWAWTIRDRARFRAGDFMFTLFCFSKKKYLAKPPLFLSAENICTARKYLRIHLCVWLPRTIFKSLGLCLLKITYTIPMNNNKPRGIEPWLYAINNTIQSLLSVSVTTSCAYSN